MDSLPQRLSEIRGKQNQKDFASLLGVNQNYISRYESGLIKPTSDFLVKLTQKLNINLNWLLTGEGNMYKTETDYTDVSRVSELEQKVRYLEHKFSKISALMTDEPEKTESKKKHYTPLKNNGIINYSLN